MYVCRFLFLLTAYYRRQLLWLNKNNWKIKLPSSGQHRREREEGNHWGTTPLENILMYKSIEHIRLAQMSYMNISLSVSLSLSLSHFFYGKCHIIVTCRIQIEFLFNWLKERHHSSFPLSLIENPFSACLCNSSAMSFSRYTWVRLFCRSRWCVFQLASLLIRIVYINATVGRFDEQSRTREG